MKLPAPTYLLDMEFQNAEPSVPEEPSREVEVDAQGRPPFPAVWDSSMLAALRSCPRKLELTYLHHWKPKTESVHLVAGKAFAHGLEHARRAFWEHTLPAEDALGLGVTELLRSYGDYQPPGESPKNPDRMAGALEYYFSVWPMEELEPILLPSGRRAIEFNFAEPLDVIHPVTGEPLIYCGRADAVAHFAEGVYIVDEKTTSSLGASWTNQWGLRSQFTAYCWAARRLGYSVAGVLVRGVSILKTKYDHAQVPTNRSDWEIDRWHHQTLRDLERAKQMWAEGYWDYNLDHACTEYGGCVFRDICKSPDPKSWLPMYFETKVWDPLAREERKL